MAGSRELGWDGTSLRVDTTLNRESRRLFLSVAPFGENADDVIPLFNNQVTEPIRTFNALMARFIFVLL